MVEVDAVTVGHHGMIEFDGVEWKVDRSLILPTYPRQDWFHDQVKVDTVS